MAWHEPFGQTVYARPLGEKSSRSYSRLQGESARLSVDPASKELEKSELDNLLKPSRDREQRRTMSNIAGVASCRQCGQPMAIPAEVDRQVTVRCPTCAAEYTVGELLDAAASIVPVVMPIVVSAQDQPAGQDVASSSPGAPTPESPSRETEASLGASSLSEAISSETIVEPGIVSADVPSTGAELAHPGSSLDPMSFSAYGGGSVETVEPGVTVSGATGEPIAVCSATAAVDPATLAPATMEIPATSPESSTPSTDSLAVTTDGMAPPSEPVTAGMEPQVSLVTASTVETPTEAPLDAVASSADVMAAPASGDAAQAPVVAAIDPSAPAVSGEAVTDSAAVTAAPTDLTTETVALAGETDMDTALPAAQPIDGSGSWISHINVAAGGSGGQSAVFDDEDVVMPAAGGVPEANAAAPATVPAAAAHGAESGEDDEDDDDFYPRDAGAGAVDIFGASDSGVGGASAPSQSEAAAGVATLEGDTPEAAPRAPRTGARAATRENLAGIPTKHDAWREKHKVNPIRAAVGIVISGILGLVVAYGLFKAIMFFVPAKPRPAPPAKSSVIPSQSTGPANSTGSSTSSGKPKKPVKWKGLENKKFN